MLRLSLARWDYLRHPVLLAEILGLHALMRLTSAPARRAVGRSIGELKVAVCDRPARAVLPGRARRPLPPPQRRPTAGDPAPELRTAPRPTAAATIGAQRALPRP